MLNQDTKNNGQVGVRVYIASDHAGFEMKKDLILYLSENGYEVYDCGPKEYVHDDDYPDYISKVARNISSGEPAFGVVIGKSGQGEAMVSNRFKNVRCAIFYGGSKHVVTLSREHNDANVLSLGSGFLTKEEARRAVDLFLHTKFSGDERHVRRIGKIDKLM